MSNRAEETSQMSDQIVIPAMYVSTPDATLSVDSENGFADYTMTLTAADGHVIAQASGFRPGAASDFGSDHPANTAGTFGAFLAAALEDSSGEMREGWDILADDASDWTDALYLMSVDENGNEIVD